MKIGMENQKVLSHSSEISFENNFIFIYRTVVRESMTSSPVVYEPLGSLFINGTPLQIGLAFSFSLAFEGLPTTRT